jgi:cytochrome P450
MNRARLSLAANFPAFANKNGSLDDLSKELDLSVLDLEKDDYIKLCLYESLRIESPVAASSSICLTETQTIGGVTIKAGDMMLINIHQLHHNED